MASHSILRTITRRKSMLGAVPQVGYRLLRPREARFPRHPPLTRYNGYLWLPHGREVVDRPGLRGPNSCVVVTGSRINSPNQGRLLHSSSSACWTLLDPAGLAVESVGIAPQQIRLYSGGHLRQWISAFILISRYDYINVPFPAIQMAHHLPAVNISIPSATK